MLSPASNGATPPPPPTPCHQKPTRLPVPPAYYASADSPPRHAPSIQSRRSPRTGSTGLSPLPAQRRQKFSDAERPGAEMQMKFAARQRRSGIRRHAGAPAILKRSRRKPARRRRRSNGSRARRRVASREISDVIVLWPDAHSNAPHAARGQECRRRRRHAQANVQCLGAIARRLLVMLVPDFRRFTRGHRHSQLQEDWLLP